MAPEQLRGAGPEPRQDLYAVGVVAADLLLGRPESEGPVAEPVSGPPPAGIPAGFWQLLSSMTVERPDDRPSSAAEARAALLETGAVPEHWPEQGLAGGGDDIEVFDHHPPLPPGWGPEGRIRPTTDPPDAPGGPGERTGPDTATVAPATGVLSTDVAPTVPQHRPAQTRTAAPTAPPGVVGQDGAGLPPEHTTPPGQVVASDRSVQPGQHDSLHGNAPSPSSGTGRRVLRGLAWGVTAVGVGMMVAGVVLLVG